MMGDVIVPVNCDEVSRSLIDELSNLSEEEWEILKMIKNESMRMFTIDCTMVFAMDEEDSEDSFAEKIVSELGKLHPKWLEYKTKIEILRVNKQMRLSERIREW